MTTDAEGAALTSLTDDPAMLTIIDDDLAQADPVASADADVWQVLLVDDDASLHIATRYSLTGVRYKGRALQILSAYSGAEGYEMVVKHPDLALILLDVVMETDSAGLDLARRIRDELGNRMVQIVLRTGQPGHAPERSVIVDYEINDYKSKTELTAERIFTTVMASLRSFEQLRAIRRQQDELSTLAHAAHRFVPQEYLNLLGKSSIADVRMGDQVVAEMTIMFIDVRSFLSLSETWTPEQTLAFVNRLLAWASRVVREHHGFVDKYLGDGAMVLFPRCVDDAVRAALAIRIGAREENQRRRERGEVPVHLGVGIHFGPVVLGIVGEEERLEATVIGDVVNSTSRLQSITKNHSQDVLISETAIANLRDPVNVETRLVDRACLRGMSREIGIYALPDEPECDDLM